MFIKKFSTFKEAVKGFIKPEIEYTTELHNLDAKEIIPWHLHHNVDEIIIIDEGILFLAIEGEREILQFGEINGGAEAVFIPKGKKHAAIAINAAFYQVYKTKGKSEMFHCNGPDLKKEMEQNLSVAERIAEGTLRKER